VVCRRNVTCGKEREEEGREEEGREEEGREDETIRYERRE
jgi:hypothetical protein